MECSLGEDVDEDQALSDSLALDVVNDEECEGDDDDHLAASLTSVKAPAFGAGGGGGGADIAEDG